ncbi:MAG: hypothetical protein NVS3B2_03540 [Ramlibacter sp.]
MKAPFNKLRRNSLDPDIRQSLGQALHALRDDDAALLGRVKTRVLGTIQEHPCLPHHTVRAGGGEWETLAPGVQRKVLWESGEACSSMVRLQPGSSFPSHVHPIDEECLILEGSLRIGADLLLLPGDFHVGLKGVRHETVSTQTGVLCFLRTVANIAETVE